MYGTKTDVKINDTLETLENAIKAGYRGDNPNCYINPELTQQIQTSVFRAFKHLVTGVSTLDEEVAYMNYLGNLFRNGFTL